MELIVKLPIFAELTSNRKKGSFWNYKKAKDISKNYAYLATIAELNYAIVAGCPYDFIGKKLHMTIEFYFECNAHRDLTNFAEGQKDAIDGIFLALKYDDWNIDQVLLIRKELNKTNPHVIIKIKDQSHD